MRLFFRNDDLGWNHDDFDRLLKLFVDSQQKLNAAAIPAICVESYNPGSFSNFAKNLQVHSHGYAHLDHETMGKKCEFGAARPKDMVLHDLKESYKITKNMFGPLYFAAFTPPWNRMAEEFIPLLEPIGFRVLSRDGDKKANLKDLKEINVNIDLHTNKKKPTTNIAEVWAEAQRLASLGTDIGIMLHHKHMADADFVFLKDLLEYLNKQNIKAMFYSDLVK